jgi:ring-1,2-phenylacetyl-CoA epoxidase subunit PaaE
MTEETDKLEFKVTRVEKAATDAKLVTIAEMQGRPVAYEAGQFLTFIIPFRGKELRRSYSIITSPGLDDGLAFVVKRRLNGEISRYLHDHLKEGDILLSLPPAGRFTYPANPLHSRTLFFIAAGSGISPVFSLIKKILFEEPLTRIILIYQNQNEEATIFRKELSALLEAGRDRFTWIDLLSNPSTQGVQPKRLNNSLLEQLVKSYAAPGKESLFYLCGPRSFMLVVQFVLKFMGYRQEQILKETFVVDTVPPPPLITDRSPKKIQLRWKNQDFHFTSAYPESILQSALRHHIRLPYSCQGGRCSSCMVRCISGKVKMSINEVLTGHDLENGWVLTCVGYAETDVELVL